MRVLVGCECSQTVAGAFLRAGHDAYSCDIQPSYGEYPERHIQGDLREVYHKFAPDLFIAHPPCTFLCVAGACNTFRRSGIDFIRYEQGLIARDFFLWCLSRPASMICVENPVPVGAFGLPPVSQYIEPFYFGEPYTKKSGFGFWVCLCFLLLILFDRFILGMTCTVIVILLSVHGYVLSFFLAWLRLWLSSGEEVLKISFVYSDSAIH